VRAASLMHFMPSRLSACVVVPDSASVSNYMLWGIPHLVGHMFTVLCSTLHVSVGLH
jgi:hypothetical protein